MTRTALTCAACAAALALCLTACGKQDTPSSSATTTAATTTATTAAAATTAAPASTVGYINATTLHVRPEPNSQNEPVGGLKFGDRVELLGREGDWYRILHNGETAYISAQFVQDTPPEAITTAAAEATPTASADEPVTTTTTAAP